MEKRSVVRPVVLCVLDGWGQRTERADNAIAEARTPVWDALIEKYPHGLLNTSGLDVGLPPGQMGNSEVGHMNLGAGRAVLQDLPRIDAAVADGSLARSPQLVQQELPLGAGKGGSLCGVRKIGRAHV